MKFNYRKLIIPVFILIVISMFAYSFNWFPTGYVGTTRKNQINLGCICHDDTASSIVNVQILGPDSVPAGTTALYRIKMSGGPAITGGFNIANQRDNGNDTLTLSGVPGDTMIRKQEGELTHSHPKPFSSDTVSWIFRYSASSVTGYDTLFATGNSTNNNQSTDTVDLWNWSLNKPVRIYNPIGIINISSVAREFSLSQNYPNPFNPVTHIKFTVAKNSDIKIKIYDILGNVIAVPVSGNMKQGEYIMDFNASGYASGAYFYSLIADGQTISTKKMLMIK
ncbi:MAG: hemagluttinin repeat-containing protein [Chlorobi bacterium OLB5]|nr:MAG: hemagluttinin repeat-containing protein [Chlorobi bacterium OLB5]